MGKCEVCEKEMTRANGCIVANYIMEDGTKFKPIKAGNDQWVDPGQRCGDCGAKYGYPHHPGCDVERCPNCGMQMIGCDCDWSVRLEVYQVK